MDELFANEELRLDTHGAIAPSMAPTAAADNIILTESRSYEDPALLHDQRILNNILKRQHCLAPTNPHYFETVQTEIKPHMRKIVSDWMLDVTEEQQCHPEVFPLAINYLDRFLSVVNIRKNQFQLLACVCMFLASKFKETCPLPAENLVIYTDNSVTALEIMQWEMLVLQVLEWDLSAVTPYSILDQIIRSFSFANEQKVRQHAETFLSLAASEYSFCKRTPAVIAVACLGAALRGLDAKSLEDMINKLEGVTGVEKTEILGCMDEIEESINLSMSGTSFQPSTSSNMSSSAAAPLPAHSTAPKIIPQQPGFFPSQSTTPTDLMDISTCVC